DLLTYPMENFLNFANLVDYYSADFSDVISFEALFDTAHANICQARTENGNHRIPMDCTSLTFGYFGHGEGPSRAIDLMRNGYPYLPVNASVQYTDYGCQTAARDDDKTRLNEIRRKPQQHGTYRGSTRDTSAASYYLNFLTFKAYEDRFP